MPSLTPAPTLRAAPTAKVLAALTALVLAGHWLALGGRIALWDNEDLKAPSELGALPSTTPGAQAPPLNPMALQAAMPAPVTVATVRWIAPPPAPEPTRPEPAPPPPKPVKIAKKPPPSKPAPVIETPVPEPLPVAQAAAPPLEPEEPLPPEPDTTTASQVPEPNSAAQSAEEVQPAPLAADSQGATSETATGPALPLVTPAPNATLNYEVAGQAKGFTYHASGTLNWQQNGTAYTARLEVSAFLLGAYVQTSTGQITPQGLAPERFAIQRRKSEKAAHFERSTGRIRYSNNAPDAPLLPGAQDQLSITLQLASLLHTYPDLGGARTVTLPVSSDGSSEPWQFEVGALQPLNLPAGPVQAQLLTRAPRRAFDKTVQLWLAPALAHLPVRMRITEHNGDFLDMLLEDLPAPQEAQPQQ